VGDWRAKDWQMTILGEQAKSARPLIGLPQALAVQLQVGLLRDH
jgi:hypothetical protein